MSTETLFTTQAAAEWLHEAISGESPDYWRQALINNRRPDRNPPHRIQFSTLGRAALYTLEALKGFAEFEKSRRLGRLKLTGRAAETIHAFGIGQSGGSTNGRKWNGGSANLSTDGDGNVFVQVIINEPLMVFAMSPDQSAEFGKELAEAGRAAKRQQGAK